MLVVTTPLAAGQEGSAPLISLIIDDLGERWDYAQRALSLPAQVTYAILPETRYGKRIAQMAHADGRDVMLHQPMEAMRYHRVDPAGLDSLMVKEEFQRQLRLNLDALPYVRGINNHMGSLLTADSQAMGWLMDELQRRGGIYFVDSRTSSDSIAYRVARKVGLPTVARDIFLDNVRTNAAIEARLVEAIKLAQRRGTAVVIGHPYPETLTVLEMALPRMKEMGIELVSVSRMIEARNQRSYHLWQASLSPSPMAAKSSKP